MEARKIAAACFIGGVLCCTVALVMSPTYWWLGLLAGFAGGYLGYEFREVLQAIPIAWRAAQQGSFTVWTAIKDEVKIWRAKSHALFYPALIAVTPFCSYGILFLHKHQVFVKDQPTTTGLTLFYYVALCVMAVVLLIELSWPIMALIGFFAFIGAQRAEKCYFRHPFFGEGDAKNLQDKGFREQPATYCNMARWFAKGIGITIVALFLEVPVTLVGGLWELVCLFCYFLWHLFKLIHSKKRVLCGMDGTLGGAISYLYFNSSGMPLSTTLMMVIFGGLLGAVFGVLNWEIVSKRILHVPVNESA